MSKMKNAAKQNVKKDEHVYDIIYANYLVDEFIRNLYKKFHMSKIRVIKTDDDLMLTLVGVSNERFPEYKK